jgi:molybdopterin converting factor small subunit
MQIRIRLFASLREAVGRSELELALAPGATAEDAWHALVERHPALAVLNEGDELVFIPPVSGG